jgi:hypothetical protein
VVGVPVAGAAGGALGALVAGGAALPPPVTCPESAESPFFFFRLLSAGAGTLPVVGMEVEAGGSVSVLDSSPPLDVTSTMSTISSRSPPAAKPRRRQ